MENKKIFLMWLTCLIIIAGTAHAGLFDPAVLNPSFESPDLTGSSSGWDYYADDWVLNGEGSGYLENGSWFPAADGINNFKMWYGGYLWQQIGTWDEGLPYDITLWVGRYDTNTAATVSLWAGGDPGLTPDRYGEIDTTVGATLIEQAVLTPTVAVGENEQMTVTLNTGTSFSSGDALWLLLDATGGDATYFDNVSVVAIETAVNVAPPNGAVNVSISTLLQWEDPPVYEPTGYDVYFGSDANELGDEYYLDNKVINNLLVTSHDPYGPEQDLEYETTYYWRVDTYEPNDLGPGSIIHIGGLWSFSTAPPEPIITTQPAGQVVPAGTDVVFTLDGVNIESYKWYEQSDPDTTLSTEQTLTVSDVQKEDEGYYLCEVANTITTIKKTSEPARLLTQRLMAHWKFDGDLTDEVDDWDGDYYDPNKPSSNPNPSTLFTTDAVEGQAFEFTGDGKLVRILGGEEYFNFHPLGFTLSVWIKRTVFPGGNWWDGVISKDGTDAGWRIDSVYGIDVDGWIGAWLSGHSDNELWLPAGISEDAQWHLAVMTYDASTKTCSIYGDGVISESITNATNELNLNAEPITIGARNIAGNYSFTGWVDEIQIWSYPLDIYTIAYLYTDLIPDSSVCPDTVTGLQFDTDGNCRIDINDLAAFAATWLNCNIVPDCK